MAFPGVNWTQVEQDLDAFFQANGDDVSVLLNDGVTTFTVKGLQRKTPAENLTDGLQQEGDRLSVMAARWLAGAGRAPEKGDLVTTNGHRQAVQAVNRKTVSNLTIGYNLTILG